MSAGLANSLRARPDVIRLAGSGEMISIRVEMPDVWDTVRIEAPPSSSVLEVKRAALEALYPDGQFPDDFVMKLRGWEILDESESLRAAGAMNGSIFLLTFRRRRPVR